MTWNSSSEQVPIPVLRSGPGCPWGSPATHGSGKTVPLWCPMCLDSREPFPRGILQAPVYIYKGELFLLTTAFWMHSVYARRRRLYWEHSEFEGFGTKGEADLWILFWNLSYFSSLRCKPWEPWESILSDCRTFYQEVGLQLSNTFISKVLILSLSTFFHLAGPKPSCQPLAPLPFFILKVCSSPSLGTLSTSVPFSLHPLQTA